MTAITLYFAFVVALGEADMKWQNNTSPFRDGQSRKRAKTSHSNIKLLMISSAFLIVATGLVLFQPGDVPDTTVAAKTSAAPKIATISAPDALPALAPLPAEYTTRPPVITRTVTPQVPPTETVTRNSPDLLDIPERPASKTIAGLLRQPIRLNAPAAQYRRLSDVAQSTLERLGHSSGSTDPLHAMLVQALAEEQSDSYIDALVNTAANQGHFTIPVTLRGPDDRFDTKRLLDELIQEAR